MGTAVALLVIGTALAVLAPRMLSHAHWQEQEPVVALWVWQCAVTAVLVCYAIALVLSGAALWPAMRAGLFQGAPNRVEASYNLGAGRPWQAVLAVTIGAAGMYLMGHLLREVAIARISRRMRYRALMSAAPVLPCETVGRERIVVLESEHPEAWALLVPRRPLQLVVSTGAMRTLTEAQLGAVLEHERNHARARHHWLLQSAGALASAFPRVSLFTGYAERVGRLVEMAADDVAARRFGRLATAEALVDLNEGRGAFGGPGPRVRPMPPVEWAPGAPVPAPVGQVAERVDRLLVGRPRLQPLQRLHLTTTGVFILVVPVLLAFAPGVAATLAR
ncbi:hypothetical protein BIV57_21600 [Mangrovactinospora gilvigrisea]|uniref:Peptidase M48 domain-containing protein n=1 Tax=Mangrovactinospora gilvigrisea TaxID=1428644 RepID=A0A1J7B9U6_9ACTN|nr:M56 family metallopeptidase [Mangrovactinospora gilvigrisea]OIV35427.1 hypothetical protein BIV57_21600 [Mangrovactinospora gilvigrisea]